MNHQFQELLSPWLQETQKKPSDFLDFLNECLKGAAGYGFIQVCLWFEVLVLTSTLQFTLNAFIPMEQGNVPCFVNISLLSLQGGVVVSA